MLLDDAWHDEKVVVLRGRVGERIGHGQAGLERIGPQAIFQVGIAEERNGGDIDFGELADVAEHIAQLLLERGDFLRGEAESREVGDIGNIDAFGRGFGHKVPIVFRPVATDKRFLQPRYARAWLQIKSRTFSSQVYAKSPVARTTRCPGARENISSAQEVTRRIAVTSCGLQPPGQRVVRATLMPRLVTGTTLAIIRVLIFLFLLVGGLLLSWLLLSMDNRLLLSVSHRLLVLNWSALLFLLDRL